MKISVVLQRLKVQIVLLIRNFVGISYTNIRFHRRKGKFCRLVTTILVFYSYKIIFMNDPNLQFH